MDCRNRLLSYFVSISLVVLITTIPVGQFAKSVASPIESNPSDTILLLSESDLGTSHVAQMLSSLDIHLLVNPASYDLNNFKVVIVGGNAANPSLVPAFKQYLQNCGNLVFTQGAPFYAAGSTDLSTIEDIAGVNYYGNTSAGFIVLTENNPYGLPFLAGDTLGYLNAGGPSMANVYSPVDTLLNKVYWTDGTLYSYARFAYSGRYFYSSVAAMLDSTNSLFAAAVQWMLQSPGCAVVSAQTHIEPNQFRVIEINALVPRFAYVYLGNLGQGRTVHDIDLGTLSVNNTVLPILTEIIPSFDNYDSEVLKIKIPVPDLLIPYQPVWDTQYETYTVIGNLDGNLAFQTTGSLSIIGHRSGDANQDGVINILDLTLLVNNLFRGEPLPYEFQSADVNRDGSVNILDLTKLVNHVFRGGNL